MTVNEKLENMQKMRNTEDIVMSHFFKCGYYPSIYLEGMRKIIKNLSWVSRFKFKPE